MSELPPIDETEPPSPSRIKELVARLRSMLASLRGSDKSSERATRRDPVTTQLRLFLWILLFLSWGLLGSLMYDRLAPRHHANQTPAGQKVAKKARSLYPWAKGYSFGHDIVEPDVEADRGLAAAINDRELKVTVGARYVEFRDIEAVLKAGMGNHSKVLLSMAFEIDTYPAEQEVLKKEMKIREIVATTLSTRDKDVLRKVDSVSKLKEELLKKLELLVTSGPVTDILITAVAYN